MYTRKKLSFSENEIDMEFCAFQFPRPWTFNIQMYMAFLVDNDPNVCTVNMLAFFFLRSITNFIQLNGSFKACRKSCATQPIQRLIFRICVAYSHTSK